MTTALVACSELLYQTWEPSMNLMDVVARRIIPVVVLDDPNGAEPLADALVAGGLPIAEVTFRTEAAIGAIKRMSARGDLLVGAGTVTTVEHVERAADAGARFVVSPGLSENVLAACAERNLPALPGVATATEIMRALAAGAEIVKFFPAGVAGGIDAIHALGAPFPELRFVPTGGITPANVLTYLREPQVAAVGGSWMVPRALIARRAFDEIRTLVTQAVRQVTPSATGVGGPR